MTGGPVFVVTPTGGRPKGLRLLAGYLNEQTYRGPLTWLICDDVDPASPVPAMRDGITVEIIRPEWRWKAASTQARSMAALLARVMADAVVIVAEDDDVYLPAHIETMLAALETAELVGQRVSLYYNVETRRFRELPGTSHASLGATALRGSAIGLLRHICAGGSRTIDMDLWRQFRGDKALLEIRTAVGIKGLPGRAGIGVGHLKAFGTPDTDGHVLREWIGGGRAWRYIPGKSPAALVLGGAGGVHEEAAEALAMFRPDAVAAANNIGIEWPGRLDYWMTLHADRTPDWPGIVDAKRQRLAKGLNRPQVWGHKPNQGIDRVTGDWRGGTGLLVVKGLLEEGFTCIVLAGVPMSRGAGYSHPKHGRIAIEQYRVGWTDHHKELAPFVRSMSGFTRSQLGEPTQDWLFS